MFSFISHTTFTVVLFFLSLFFALFFLTFFSLLLCCSLRCLALFILLLPYENVSNYDNQLSHENTDCCDTQSYWIEYRAPCLSLCRLHEALLFLPHHPSVRPSRPFVRSFLRLRARFTSVYFKELSQGHCGYDCCVAVDRQVKSNAALSFHKLNDKNMSAEWLLLLLFFSVRKLFTHFLSLVI